MSPVSCYLLTAVITLAFLSVQIDSFEFATNNWYVKLQEPLAHSQLQDLVKPSGFRVVGQVSPIFTFLISCQLSAASIILSLPCRS